MIDSSIKTVEIKNIKEECKNIKTFTFNSERFEMKSNLQKPKPGQFVMIWVPGVDEVPMSISGVDDGNWKITVKNVGECTNKLHELEVGDYIGIKGPYGNYFSFPDNTSAKIILVAGGFGTAPLKFLAKEMLKNKYNFTLIQGARNQEDILFLEDLEQFDQNYSEMVFCTDDGSFGYEGFSTQQLEKIITKISIKEMKTTYVYTCGPEKMMYRVFEICEQFDIPLQASLERMMRCGCGLCGLCAIDPLGLLVCKDGPVFDSNQLRAMDDFGKFKRDFTGKKIPID
ncbi:MAG: dihydroorotate dehydrogenase electron transfer subunit [Candidatus Lokiarchaeota archaeon]|nr:dihydroorotate dehydrogenase electron transfer subunit [Candidatus Lokiarchaeota archaeon]MBD3199311.1 dihydroorotate dehydrogenase electron transfer subunit [Candidatus Lokiarchaeota archaeon]